jgi:hypothetical protein
MQCHGHLALLPGHQHYALVVLESGCWDAYVGGRPEDRGFGCPVTPGPGLIAQLSPGDGLFELRREVLGFGKARLDLDQLVQRIVNHGQRDSGVTGVCRRADRNDADRVRRAATVGSGTWNGAGQLTVYASPLATMNSATYNGDGERTAATFGTAESFTWGTSVSAAPQLLMDSGNAYI